MKIKKKTHFKIDIDIYSCKIILFVCYNGNNDIYKTIKKNYANLICKKALKSLIECDNELPVDPKGIMNPNDNLFLIRTYNKNMSDLDHLSNLHHEIFHATTYILDRVGMKHELQSSEESYAYLFSYICDLVYPKIFKD